MKFTNMTVAARLSLGFALVILAGLAVAIYGRIQLGRVSDEITLLIDDRIVKVEQVTEIIDNLNINARAMRNMAMLTDEQGMQAEKQRIDEARARNTELLSQLGQSIRSEEGRALLRKVSEVRAPYTQVSDKAIALTQAGRSEEARDVLIKENRPLQSAYFKVLGELIQMQKKAMNEAARTSKDISSTTGAVMLTVALLAALVGAMAAWLLTRSITRQLGGEPDYAAGVVREIAAGNLAMDIRLRAGDQASLLAAMKDMRDNLARIVSQVRLGSESVASASTQIAQGNQDLSGRTESQASSLEETAASMEELGSTVHQNADNARQANQLAQNASAVAQQGGQVVSQVVHTMKGISDSSRKIADIINVIDGIAFQTNILALNAAVEAARAGDQGRGFAVVASEVRSLAGRSAEAAKEIKQLITESVERVEAGTQLVDQAGSTMHEVVTSIQRVTDIMGEISAASTEQSSGVAQVGEAVTSMDQVTQQNAALVEEMAAAATSLQGQASQLVQTVSVFKLAHDQNLHRSATVAAPASPAPTKTRPGIAQKDSKPLRTLPVSPTKAADGDQWESF
ncbi:MAG: methyl-accepting chemotaxis protein [Giesbergeria sp.]|jgi:methyl-accepting chemotaxis protein|nr:methyl-accepting chemotaxis protein [Giesbergeria sp.]